MNESDVNYLLTRVLKRVLNLKHRMVRSSLAVGVKNHFKFSALLIFFYRETMWKIMCLHFVYTALYPIGFQTEWKSI